jgi:ParB-like chromosome segregation protein Spo0J
MATRTQTQKKTKGKAEVERRFAKLERLNVIYVPIDSIRYNGYNPNRQSDHDFDLLCKSMEEDGFTQPILVNDGSTAPQHLNEIVDGEHRHRAARVLGYEEVPIVYVPFTAEQMRISTLRHNRARGSEDMELSAEVLRDLQRLGALDMAQDSLMMDDIEMQHLLDDIGAAEALASEEFSTAWEPTSAQDTTLDGKMKPEHGVRQDSMTPEAADAIRENERRIQEAKTDEERALARRDADLFRITLLFAGEQARIVRAVLGSEAAPALLRLCTAELARLEAEAASLQAERDGLTIEQAQEEAATAAA